MIPALLIIGALALIILPFIVSRRIVAKAKKQIESERQTKND
jgi:type II secretory pathway pseudopilin PulG